MTNVYPDIYRHKINIFVTPCKASGAVQLTRRGNFLIVLFPALSSSRVHHKIYRNVSVISTVGNKNISTVQIKSFCKGKPKKGPSVVLVVGSGRIKRDSSVNFALQSWP